MTIVMKQMWEQYKPGIWEKTNPEKSFGSNLTLDQNDLIDHKFDLVKEQKHDKVLELMRQWKESGSRSVGSEVKI